MDIQMWQVLAGLTVMIAAYWLGTELLGSTGSAVILAVLILFGGIGIVVGRRLAKQRQ